MRRPMLAMLWRFRPRALTLILLAIVAALIVLANLTYEVSAVEDADPQTRLSLFLAKMSYGWPLSWRRRLVYHSPGPCGFVGWQYSASRLAGNAAMWLVMLGLPTGVCEWLLRRYRPRPRWSLRVLLVGVGLTGVLCAWIAAARDRADLQDPIFDAINAQYNARIVLERWGPQWLEVIGADRYRRCVIGVDFALHPDEQLAQELLERLTRLPKLRYLSLHVDRLSLGMAAALREMRNLRTLHISQDYHRDYPEADDKLASRELLAAIGGMTRLESLHLQGIAIGGDSLPHLDRLGNLNSLGLVDCINADRPVDSADLDDPPLLRRLPPLPRLQVLDLEGSYIGDRDLRYLAALPRLESLCLEETSVTSKGLAELARSDSLEELAIGDVLSDDAVSAARLESLRSLKGLKKLHLRRWTREWEQSTELSLDDGGSVSVPQSDADGFRAALSALRHAKPGIIVDGGVMANGESLERSIPWDREKGAEFFRTLPEFPSATWASIQASLPKDAIENLKW